MGISDDAIGDVSNPSLLAVTLDPTLGLRRRKGRRLSNGDFPREIPIGDVIKLLSILNRYILNTVTCVPQSAVFSVFPVHLPISEQDSSK